MQKLSVNGKTLSVDVSPGTPLLWVLRDSLGLTGTKYGCGIGQCGACTVHLDGVAVRSCVLPVSSIAEQVITTIEVIASDRIGQKVQAAWLAEEVVQCGYCQSGQIMSAVALLHRNPSVSESDIVSAMSGNICRCATYTRIRTAINNVALELAQGNANE